MVTVPVPVEETWGRNLVSVNAVGYSIPVVDAHSVALWLISRVKRLLWMRNSNEGPGGKHETLERSLQSAIP
jgi:hypothetical protein